MGADERELLEIIRKRSFRTGEFTLASGAKSNLYFNLKPTMMDPRGARLCAEAFLARLPEGTDYVGGLEMGAVPIIAALAAISDIQGKPVKTIFVRKAPKSHGTQDVIEGLGPDETLNGKHVVMVDDVATSGGSMWKSIEAVRAAGAVVDLAMSVVDRQEGASEFLAERGVRLEAVLKAGDFFA